MDRFLPNQVINRTRWPTYRVDAAIRRPYKRKDQCVQVALAVDNVMGAWFTLNRGECEDEIQSAELRLHAPVSHDYGLKTARAHLAALGAPEPEMPPYDPSPHEPIEQIDIDTVKLEGGYSKLDF